MKKKPAKTVLSSVLSQLHIRPQPIAAPSVEMSKLSMQSSTTSDSADPKQEIHSDLQPVDRPIEDWNVSTIKHDIAEAADKGRLSPKLVQTLCRDGLCAPVEYELLDYKEMIGNTPYDKAKLVLRVVSFFNSFGGYIVFGVKETEPETRFDIVGVKPNDLDIESLKASIKEFTGVRVQITASVLDAATVSGESVNLLFLHIPKRHKNEPPLHFLKDGPGGDKKRPAFSKDDVYCRRSDECVQARGPRIFELTGERTNPYLQEEGPNFSGKFRVNRIPHNLPDRNFICPKFVGRAAVVNSLWRWLADDLSHIRVLAGEGGLGKSSIAYEFAERVSETQGVPFEHLVWLTAKEKQFNAFDDQYVKVPERHYTSYDELLFAICERLPFTTEELAGATTIELRRMVKKGLSETSSLIIIDDIDSLPPEQQRQVLELGMILGNTSSRLLLTTRFNQSYSNDNVIQISGLLLGDEFNSYLDTLRERLSFIELKTSEIEKIHHASNGSPLFSESLIRLLRWNSVNDAIALWKNERGAAVRTAALKREVELLSAQAQRILLTIALLGEASAVELTEVLGYPSEVIERGLSDLLSLFLLAAPSLASIPRFRVPDNTQRLVLDRTAVLVTDRARLEKDIEAFRRRSERTPTRDSRVASAISQAGALLRTSDLEGAIATIKDARKRTQDHFDLLSYEATLYLKATPPQVEQARALARKAFTNGCRKPEVYECWFEAEWLAEHYIGALEAADAALDGNCTGTQDWMIKKAAALASKASDQAKAGAHDGAVSTMFEASATLRQAIPRFRRDDALEWEALQATLHDQIWLWPNSNESGLAKTVFQLDMLEKMRKLGDFRITNLRRVLSAIEGMAVMIERKLTHLSSSQKNLCGSLVARAQALLGRSPDISDDSRNTKIDFTWEILRTRVEDAISRHEFLNMQPSDVTKATPVNFLENASVRQSLMD